MAPRPVRKASLTAGGSTLIAGPSFDGGFGRAAYAQDEDLFKRLDKNQDGQISADEIDDERKRLFERLLREGDKNQDGKIDPVGRDGAEVFAEHCAEEGGRHGDLQKAVAGEIQRRLFARPQRDAPGRHADCSAVVDRVSGR